MKKPTDDGTANNPIRWLSRPEARGGDAPEDRLASLMRAGAPTEGLRASDRARVWTRLTRTQRRARPAARLSWSVAAAAFLTSGAVVAAVAVHRWWTPSPPVEIAPAAAPTTVRAQSHGGARAEIAPAHAPDELPPLAPTAPSLAPPAPTRARSVASRPRASATSRPTLAADELPVVAPGLGAALSPLLAPEPPPRFGAALPGEPAGTQREVTAPDEPRVATAPVAPPSALANETRLLGDALASLRQRQDARGALTVLDAYDTQFPNGTLRGEAARARVDALLLVGRDGDALAVLQRLTLQPQTRDQELRVVRGELAAATSCERAVVDFDRVLAEAAAPSLAERALHGRASCAAQRGDAAAATRDLREYLRRFPDGRFAAEARRAVSPNNL